MTSNVLRSVAKLLALGLMMLLVALIFSPPVQSASSTILITAVYYDTYISGEPDEAYRLMNVSGSPVSLTDWTVSDGEGTITLIGTLPAGDSLWIAREADDFESEFGFKPDYEYGSNTDPAVPDLARSGTMALANSGDEMILRDDASAIVDSVVYDGGSTSGTDWSGATIDRYNQGYFGQEGQILYRKLDQATGLPVSDTDTAADWAQATDSDIDGKKIMYPGWDLERYFSTNAFTETATITYTVAPDGIYETVVSQINRATESIYYEGYTFKNAHLADAIVARMTANPGMTVTLLLEGEPVGGIEDQEKWICQQIENAGGQVYFMYTDDPTDVHDRYNYQHAKFMVIDEAVLLTGSENLNYSSMPADNKSDGTSGNRGVWMITDSPSAIAHALDVFAHDVDPVNHNDLFRWTAGDPNYGAPTPGFTPDYSSGGTSYTPVFTAPLTISGTFSFEIVQSPENALRDSDSLLGMIIRAGSGDTVLVEQLYEYTFWGPTSSNPTDDPNPRLEAYISAARHGAEVRILLDSVFDDPGDVRGNTATCTYVNGIAATESLTMSCRIGNPTGNGIHNKMVLVMDGSQGYVHTGSINGSENSSKNNREMAIQVKSTEAYQYLASVFWHDWGDVTCGDPATLIHDIQGNTATSPEDGNTHTIEGIVVGDFQRITGNNRLSGFFVQEESGDWDADATTSEGIFVYEGSSSLLDVDEGDRVRLSGVVDEYYGLTEITNLNYVSLCSTGNTVTAVSVTLPEAVDGDLERYEGMRVSISTPITVAQTYYLGRYGQMTLSGGGRLYQPTNQYEPGSFEAQNLTDANARSLLILDDGMDVDACGENPYPVPYLGSPPPNVIRAGDTVTNLVGVLDYGQVNSGSDGPCYQPGTTFARDYRLHPVQAPTFTPANTRTAAPDSVGGSIKVGSFNVLNYFNGDGMGGGFPTSRGAGSLSEFNRQSDKIVDAIVTLDADIVGLMELENDGFGANSAIQELVDRLNAVAGAGTYAFIDPGAAAIGVDEITVGLIYQPGSVTPVGSAAILDRTSFTDPNSLGEQKNRPALAQTFEDNALNEQFTVVVNHLKSKGSACGPGDDDLTTGQGNCNATRTAGVTDQISWLASDPTGSGDPDFLVLGDLNAYAQEDPIAEFVSNGYTNLIDQYLGATAYSYVFDGQLGYLDHALANGAMASQVTGVTEWHINADEPSVIDYDEDYNPPGYYSADPYRSSDHDPVLIGLDLTLANQPPVADAGFDQSVGTNAPVTLNGSGSSDPDGDLPLTYYWTQTGDPAVTLSNPAAVTPTFTAPNDPTVLTFTLVVTDSLGLSDPTPDEVVVTVEGYRVCLPLVLRNHPPPGTTGNIDITDIFYDGAGGAEPDEYVEIRSDDTQPIQLSGWTLRDVANHAFTFPSYVMQPGQVCRIYTNENHPEWCGFNYGSGSAIWNNGGDTAYLRGKDQVTIFRNRVVFES
jgi:predicted extracellular nuclease